MSGAQFSCKQDEGMFLYSAVSSPLGFPVRWTAQRGLHFTSGRPFHSDTNAASLESIPSRKDYSFTFPPLYVARYSSIQLSELGRRGVNETALTSKRWLLTCIIYQVYV